MVEVVGAGPVRVPAGGALVDALGQGAHPGDALGDLLPEQHSAAAGLGALAEHDLDGVGLAQVVGVHPVARRQVLVDEVLATGRAPRGSCRRRRWWSTCRPRWRRGRGPPWPARTARRSSCPAMVTGMSRCSGCLALPVAEDDVGVAALAVALQRVARHRRAEEQQVVEVRQRPLGAPAADVVDAGLGGALDVGDGGAVEGGGLAQAQSGSASDVAVVISSSLRRCRRGSGRGCGPSRSGCSRRVVVPEAGGLEQPAAVRRGARRASPSRRSRRRGGDVAAHVDPGLVDRVAECLTGVAADDEPCRPGP